MRREGVIIAKFWMHVSPEEQLERFEDRAADPLRQWKLTDEDWRNREKRDVYDEATEEMFERTDHSAAPWNLIAGDQKKWARIAVLETVDQAGRRGPRDLERILKVTPSTRSER